MIGIHGGPCPLCRLPLGRLLVLLSAVALLQGCVVFLGVQAAVGVIGGATLLAKPDMEPIAKTEVDQESLAYPIDVVFTTLQHTVESNGRKIVEPISSSYTLRVSYPFSLFANNWGGVITITCIPAGLETTIVILGSGRDTNERLAKIGHEIVHDVQMALRQPSEAH